MPKHNQLQYMSYVLETNMPTKLGIYAKYWMDYIEDEDTYICYTWNGHN